MTLLKKQISKTKYTFINSKLLNYISVNKNDDEPYEIILYLNEYLGNHKTVTFYVDKNYPGQRINNDIAKILTLINEGEPIISLDSYFGIIESYLKEKTKEEKENDEQEDEIIHYG
jgi:hypothetical protein